MKGPRLTPNLIDAIVRRETPAGWHVIQSKRRDAWTGSGEADIARCTLSVPPLTNIRNLIIFFHEVAHVRLNHWANASLLVHAEEHEAWVTAFKTARSYGLDVPARSVWVAKYLVREQIARDMEAGRPIRRKAKRWAGA